MKADQLLNMSKFKTFSNVENSGVAQIPYTQRHCMWIDYTDDSDGKTKAALATFTNPEKRCRDIFGDSGQLIDNAIFISNRLILVNF